MFLFFFGRGDWHINGHDYGRNFTLNICEPVLSDYSDVVGVNDRTNVSGYYIDNNGDKISIGYDSIGFRESESELIL